jgi:hypothetical protein
MNELTKMTLTPNYAAADTCANGSLPTAMASPAKKGDGLGYLGRLPTEVRLLVLEDLLRGAILHAKPTVMADGNTTDRHPPLHIFTNIEHDTILHVSDQLHCEAMDALAMSIHLVVPGGIHGRVKLQDPLRNLPNPFLASLKIMQVSTQQYKYIDRDRLRSLKKLHLLQVIDGTGEPPALAKTMKKRNHASLLDDVTDDVLDWRQRVKDMNCFEKAQCVVVFMTIRVESPARVESGV